MNAAGFAALWASLWFVGGCVQAGDSQGAHRARPQDEAGKVPEVKRSLRAVVRSAAASYRKVARDESSYDTFRHGVKLHRPPLRSEEGQPWVKIGEDKNGEPVWGGGVKRPPLEGRILGITNRAGHPARIIADLLRLGADHDMLNVWEMLCEAEHPMNRAFLLLALEEYKNADTKLLSQARKVLDGKTENIYLLIAAMRVAARYGFPEDLERVETYLEHSDIGVRSAAGWAWSILDEAVFTVEVREDEAEGERPAGDGLQEFQMEFPGDGAEGARPPQGRKNDLPLYPPERIEDSCWLDAIREWREKQNLDERNGVRGARPGRASRSDAERAAPPVRPGETQACVRGMPGRTAQEDHRHARVVA